MSGPWTTEVEEMIPETLLDRYPDGWAPVEPSTYPNLRAALDPTYAEASDEELERYVAAAIPGVTAAELEQVADDLGRTLARIAPGALSGALTGLQVGTAAAPGWGSLIGAGVGALGGGLMSLLSPPEPPRTAPRPQGPAAPRPPQPPQRPSPGTPAGGPPPRPAPRHTPGAGPAAPQAGAAAAQLLALLTQPQVIQALTALALGAGGRREVHVDGAPVPTGDVAEAVARLAVEASSGGRP